jgi:2-isopropylmalate synthase
LKLLPQDRLAALTATAHAIAELANLPPDHRQPYVGGAAFATKAGLHASAIARRADAYSHVDPARVGNQARVLVSELAGRSNVLAKAGELGLDLVTDPELGTRVLDRVKELERQGDGSDLSEATVRLRVDGERVLAVGEGVGPVHALDQALRRALADRHPELEAVRLVDFKVRILDGRAGTRAVTRVLITSADGEHEWTTVGVSDDIVTASWEALADGVLYGLLRVRQPAVVP